MKRTSSSIALLFILLVTSACSASPYIPSALDPRGSAAVHIASLWWVMVAFSAAIFVLVVGLLLAAILRRRRGTSLTVPDSNDSDVGRKWLIQGGIVLPLVVLAITFGYTIYTLAAIENPQNNAAIHINVVARRWWWEVQYPGQGVTTANEIHIPVGIPVQFQLVSDDVIHSFWVPQLQGKMDVIPTHPNTITLQADQVGVYRGVCAEFCGLQHAMMGLEIVAQSRDDYEKWLVDQQQPAAISTDPAATQGQQVFLSAGCDFCHNVNGLNEKQLIASTPDLGPDLTHLASRTTIVGASLANNTSDLAGWVVDAQHIKQGSDMPKMSLSSQDLQTLLAFLQSLR